MSHASPHTLPWSTPVLWQAANQSIVATIEQHTRALQPFFDLAHRIRERINVLDAHMNHLCRHTCSQCRDICCRHAHAYFDFKDLLYLHLGQCKLPDRQTLAKARQTCCYLSSDGCLLPRPERPFICTWYLCPDQSTHMKQMAPSVTRFVLNSLKALKTGRLQMETGYIRVAAGSGLPAVILTECLSS